MLSGLDWLIVVILIVGLIRGYMIGAVRQVASLLGLVVAFFFSVEFMGIVGMSIVSALGLSDSLAPIAGFTVIFLGVWILFLILSRLVERVVDTLSLTPLNRAAGSAVGAFKAALLLSLLFLILMELEVPGQRARQQSALYYPVARLLPATLEATEDWFPAARDAADQLGRRVRSDIELPDRGTSTLESVEFVPDA